MVCHLFFVYFVTRLLLLFSCLACMCDLSFWFFCIELILTTVSPMEHKRDATVAGLGWPSNPNRGSASTESAPESGGQASELCHPVAPAPTTSTTSAPLKANTTPNDLGTTSLNDTYSAPALPDVPFPTEPSPTYNFFQRPHFSSRVVHQIHFKIITHSNNTRELFIEEIPTSGSPNVVILNITSTVFLAIGSGPYALRIIGATTLRFL